MPNAEAEWRTGEWRIANREWRMPNAEYRMTTAQPPGTVSPSGIRHSFGIWHSAFAID
jgi:hypothetical protein